MASLKTSSSSKNVHGRLRRSNLPNERCKRHPKHRQSPGVCSLCLSQKLSQLSSHSSTVASSFSSSSSSSSSHYSSLSSSCSSSPRGVSFSFLLFNGKNLLSKSRSVAFGSRMRSKEDDDDHKKKKGRSFLSKLLHPRKQGSFMAVFV